MQWVLSWDRRSVLPSMAITPLTAPVRPQSKKHCSNSCGLIRANTRINPQEFEQSFFDRSEEHTSELQSLRHLVCRLLLETKNTVTSILRHSLIYRVDETLLDASRGPAQSLPRMPTNPISGPYSDLAHSNLYILGLLHSWC